MYRGPPPMGPPPIRHTAVPPIQQTSGTHPLYPPQAPPIHAPLPSPLIARPPMMTVNQPPPTPNITPQQPQLAYSAPPPNISFTIPPPVQYVAPATGHYAPPSYTLPSAYPVTPQYIPYAGYPAYPTGYSLPTQQPPPPQTPVQPYHPTYNYSQPPPPIQSQTTPNSLVVRERSPHHDRERSKDRRSEGRERGRERGDIVIERGRERGDIERGRERGDIDRERERGDIDRERGDIDRDRRAREDNRRRDGEWRKDERRSKEFRDGGDKERIWRERRDPTPGSHKKTDSSHGRNVPDKGTGLRLVPYEDDSAGDEEVAGPCGRDNKLGHREENFRGRRREESRGNRDDERIDREHGSSRENRRGDRERKVKNKSKSPTSVKQEPGTEKDYSKLSPEEIIEQEKKVWIRSAPADLYYQRDRKNPGIMRATERSLALQTKFKAKLIDGPAAERAKHPVEEPPKLRVGHSHSHGDEDSSESDEEDSSASHRVESLDWLQFRSKAANRAHAEVWQNMTGELNDGPACRCSKTARETGIRHGIYVGEGDLPELDMATNNWDKLYHYRVTISPPTNFLIKHPTIIHHDEHEFIFEGFSMFTVDKIPDLPVCKVVRFNIEYNILYFEEKMPENFTVGELDMFHKYFFHELLELWDWSVDGRFFFMPRFVRDLSENGKEILSMNEVVTYMLKSYSPMIEEMDLIPMTQMSQSDWQLIADKSKGMLVTLPGSRPTSLRVDQLDREQDSAGVIKYPDIVHFGIRPPQLSYAGSQEYQKAWREFVKFRHLLANMAKPTFKDRRELETKEQALQEMRSNTKLKRDCTAVIPAQGYLKTGLMTDIVQHAMLLPVLVNHLRLNRSLDHLEKRIKYKFNNRYLLQQAVTHPSYKENFGTNPDHIRNTLSNCGIRQPEYGDKKIHFQNTRKRGINMLINIMSRFGKKNETDSKVQHNERLEFLGDAVVEFITSVHLFYMFPDLEEGGLATYRAAIVQNQHLAILAEGLGLERYMLYAHGSDLCHDSELKHAMANCFEALMGAIFLDGGIDLADRVFSEAMFGSEFDLYDTWTDMPQHPLQTQEPGGDRHWIQKFPVLKKLTKFEDMTGIEFTHIRLLARSFTDRSIGFNNLTLGSNQRMEFLGDTVLQLITSDFLYKHFPDHHEGHLSLLRSSLVNNRTQSVVCDDLGMTKFAVYANPKAEIKIKDKADLLEAFLGALYVDKDLEWCTTFAHVCFFPRLRQFILNQDWNDPKSKLQQCCLTLRTMDGGEPDIPVYKVIECKGPTNTRVYTVAVYFRGDRLAKDHGHSIQQAEMNAAKIALEECAHLFPHLNYQKRIMERSFKKQGVGDIIRDNWYQETLKKRAELGMDIKTEVKVEVKAEESQAQEQEDIGLNQLFETEEEVSKDKSTMEETEVKTSGSNSTELGGGTNGDDEKKRKENKDQVRKEIKEIEEKLAKKHSKENKLLNNEVEDGECIDSEEDFDINKDDELTNPVSTSEDKAKQKKEENKKRWTTPLLPTENKDDNSQKQNAIKAHNSPPKESKSIEKNVDNKSKRDCKERSQSLHGRERGQQARSPRSSREGSNKRRDSHKGRAPSEHSRSRYGPSSSHHYRDGPPREHSHHRDGSSPPKYHQRRDERPSYPPRPDYYDRQYPHY